MSPSMQHLVIGTSMARASSNPLPTLTNFYRIAMSEGKIMSAPNVLW